MSAEPRIATLLICHAGEPLHTDGVARWLAATTDLRGIVRIHEPGRMFWRRVRRWQPPEPKPPSSTSPPLSRPSTSPRCGMTAPATSITTS
jgi:hypothetical protein